MFLLLPTVILGEFSGPGFAGKEVVPQILGQVMAAISIAQYEWQHVAEKLKSAQGSVCP